MELCDGLGIHFNMYFSEGGQPTLFAAETDQGEALQVEMVVATVLHDEPTASQVRRTAGFGGAVLAGQVGMLSPGIVR